MGGTSNINFLIHLRGHPKDYDYIANITGDNEWSFEGCLKHFKSVEDYHGEWDDGWEISRIKSKIVKNLKK